MSFDARAATRARRWTPSAAEFKHTVCHGYNAAYLVLDVRTSSAACCGRPRASRSHARAYAFDLILSVWIAVTRLPTDSLPRPAWH